MHPVRRNRIVKYRVLAALSGLVTAAIFRRTQVESAALGEMNTATAVDSPRSTAVLTGKTARVLVCFIFLAFVPYAIPRFREYRVFLPALAFASRRNSAPSGSLDSPLDETGPEEVAPVGASGRAASQSPGPVKPGEIEDPSGHALDAFFHALKAAEGGAGKAIVCHYGDSPITDDGITSTIRERLQAKFGDGGHGFVLIAKPWGWYQHHGVIQDPGKGWDSDPMFISRGDHLYGLGGATFTTDRPQVTATFATVADGPAGHSVDSFDVYYLAQPGGGDFDVEVDGAPYARVATADAATHSGFYRVTVPEGAHSLKITTAGGGEVRLFGVVLESGSKGVEYDSLGVNGAFIGLLAHYMDEAHWVEQLRRRKPDLVILNYGTNESQFESLRMDQYEKDTNEAIRRIREAIPGVSIMLVGPMDRGMRGEGGEIITRPMIPKLIAYQRKIAAESGCAFFDTFTAMGGAGTVSSWYEARPRLMGGDLTHPTARGAQMVGDLIAGAVMRAYQAYINTPVPAEQVAAPKAASLNSDSKIHSTSAAPVLK